MRRAGLRRLRFSATRTVRQSESDCSIDTGEELTPILWRDLPPLGTVNWRLYQTVTNPDFPEGWCKFTTKL